MLIHVFVSKLPNKAAARFARKIQAKNKAIIGPAPGMIPENTPKHNP